MIQDLTRCASSLLQLRTALSSLPLLPEMTAVDTHDVSLLYSDQLDKLALDVELYKAGTGGDLDEFNRLVQRASRVAATAHDTAHSMESKVLLLRQGPCYISRTVSGYSLKCGSETSRQAKVMKVKPVPFGTTDGGFMVHYQVYEETQNSCVGLDG